MRSARPLLRLLAVILRVAALVVMVPVFAQAHAGHAHADGNEFGHTRSAGPTRSVAAPRLDAVAVIAAETHGDRATCPGCPGCCCGHTFVAAPDVAGIRADRLSGRRVAMGPDSARPSAVPEAIPEPPRPFA